MNSAKERLEDAKKLLDVLAFVDIEAILRSRAALKLTDEAYKLFTTAYAIHLNWLEDAASNAPDD